MWPLLISFIFVRSLALADLVYVHETVTLCDCGSESSVCTNSGIAPSTSFLYPSEATSGSSIRVSSFAPSISASTGDVSSESSPTGSIALTSEQTFFKKPRGSTFWGYNDTASTSSSISGPYSTVVASTAPSMTSESVGPSLIKNSTSKPRITSTRIFNSKSSSSEIFNSDSGPHLAIPSQSSLGERSVKSSLVSSTRSHNATTVLASSRPFNASSKVWSFPTPNSKASSSASYNERPNTSTVYSNSSVSSSYKPPTTSAVVSNGSVSSSPKPATTSTVYSNSSVSSSYKPPTTSAVVSNSSVSSSPKPATTNTVVSNSSLNRSPKPPTTSTVISNSSLRSSPKPPTTSTVVSTSSLSSFSKPPTTSRVVSTSSLSSSSKPATSSLRSSFKPATTSTVVSTSSLISSQASSSESSTIPTTSTGASSLIKSTPVKRSTSPTSHYSSELSTSSQSTTSTTASTTSSSAEPTQTLNSYQEDILDYHNKVRILHQVGSLVWNQTLADFATEYVNERVNGTQCLFEHSYGPYGENIALGFGSTDQAMQAWYNEYSSYNYTAGQFGENTGHFTQMVWKGSTSVGCATKKCSDSRPYLACEYWPRGNVIGSFTENVFPAK